MKDVRAELDAETDGAERGGAFEDVRREPWRASASAAVSPPSPPPTTRMGSCWLANTVSTNQKAS